MKCGVEIQLNLLKRFSMRERLCFQDKVLFIIIFILPYLTGGPWFTLTSFSSVFMAIGPSFLCFILSVYLFIYSLCKHYRIIHKRLYVVLVLAVCWSILKVIETSIAYGITEALVIYRKNYILLPSFLLCLPYISSLSINKIQLLFKLILKWIIPLTIIYLLQCIGIPVFKQNVRLDSVSGISVTRNIIGLPPIFPAIFAICFVEYIFFRQRKMLYYVLIFIVLCFISYTRNLIATSVIIIAITVIYYSYKKGFGNIFKYFMYALLVVTVLRIIAPVSFKFWDNLISNTINSELVEDTGTYAFRQRLISSAIETTQTHNCLWTGLGYVRDAEKGEYSFVLGGDTYVAPIIWCEGLIGLFFRVLPCVILCVNGFYWLRKGRDERTCALALIIVATVLSQVLNYVQTSIFVKYNETLAILFIVYVYLRKYHYAAIKTSKQIR